MSIGAPRPGQVIRYSFRWSDGAEKERPAVVVLATRSENDGTFTVRVVPITHSPPRDPETAIEIPAKLKAFLGLDGERSWVICSEINKFTWPGFDLRPVPGKPVKWEYGQMPPAFHTQITQRMKELFDQARYRSQNRDEEAFVRPRAT